MRTYLTSSPLTIPILSLLLLLVISSSTSFVNGSFISSPTNIAFLKPNAIRESSSSSSIGASSTCHRNGQFILYLLESAQRRTRHSLLLQMQMDHHHGSDNTNSTSSYFQDEDCYDLCDAEEQQEQEAKEEDEGITVEFKDIPISKQDIPQQQTQTQMSSGTKKNHDNKSSSSSTPSSSQTTPNNTTNKDKEQKEDKEEKSFQKVKNNLQLRWDIDKTQDDCNLDDISSCSEPCDICRGSGLVDCSFCNGVGWIDFGNATPGTMGERLAKKNHHNDGGSDNGDDGSEGEKRLGVECPVCNDDGQQVCQKCMGSGWIAKWRTNQNLTDLRP